MKVSYIDYEVNQELPGVLTSSAGCGRLRQGNLEAEFDFADVRGNVRRLEIVLQRNI